MPATFPNWAPAWALARDMADPGLMLATIVHPTFETLRLVKDVSDVVSRGLTFKAAYFEVDFVNDDGKPPRVSFRFPNVSPEIGRKFSRVVDPIEVTLEAISLAHPDEPIRRAARLQLRNINIQPDFITGSLLGRDYSTEQLGTKRVVPSRFPALFRRRG